MPYFDNGEKWMKIFSAEDISLLDIALIITLIKQVGFELHIISTLFMQYSVYIVYDLLYNVVYHGYCFSSLDHFGTNII